MTLETSDMPIRKAITLDQRAPDSYIVHELVNMVRPKICAELNGRQVKDLIDAGVTVTIT